MIWADLHIHSRWSDGSQTVEEILRDADWRTVNVVSITDHDTVKGTEEALYWGSKFNIEVLPGIEISAYDYNENKKIHLLGYNYNSDAKHIHTLCDPLLEARNLNTIRQIDILLSAGYPISQDAVRIEAGEAPILYKQHIMQILKNKGLTNHIYSDLYRQLFKNEGICKGDIAYLDVFDAMKAILDDGGLPVIAHPGLQDSMYLIPQLAEKGLWGIELNHEGNTFQDRVNIVRLAEQYNLTLTGGSDTHGIYGSLNKLGDIVAPRSFSIQSLK